MILWAKFMRYGLIETAGIERYGEYVRISRVA